MPSAVTDKPLTHAPVDTAELLVPTGIALHPRRRRTIRAGVVAVVLLAAYHCAMVFLAIAPPSILKDHTVRQVDWWIYPWFEQGWKMFAPEPVSANLALEVRVRGGDGTSPWVNLTALDDARIRGDLMTSREHANVLRRAWDGLEGVDLEKGPSTPHEEIKFDYARNLMVSRMTQLGYEDISQLQVRVRLRDVPPYDDMDAEQPLTTVQFHWWRVPA